MIKEDYLPGHVHRKNAVGLIGTNTWKTHAALLREKLGNHRLSSNEDLYLIACNSQKQQNWRYSASIRGAQNPTVPVQKTTVCCLTSVSYTEQRASKIKESQRPFCLKRKAWRGVSVLWRVRSGEVGELFQDLGLLHHLPTSGWPVGWSCSLEPYTLQEAAHTYLHRQFFSGSYK